MTDQSSPSPRDEAIDEKLDAVLETVAENTTTLFDVQKQAAATAASMKDARGYMQTAARNTDWETNGTKIAAVLTGALEKDHTALHASARAANDMRGLSVELTHRSREAAAAQQNASETFHGAAERLLRVMEAHEKGKWRRWGSIALTGALCAAVGFFAREPASRFEHLWDARNNLKQNAHGPDCGTLDGIKHTNDDGRRACVTWEATGG